MYVEIGNPRPVQCATGPNGEHTHRPVDTGGAPAVTYLSIPAGDHADGTALYGVDPAADLNLIARHLASRPGNPVTHLPGHEALLSVIHPDGTGAHHLGGDPSWVRADNPDLGRLLASWYGVPLLDRDDTSFEATHFTLAGPPGRIPGDARANISQNGRDMWARALGGGQVGAAGTASSAPTSTTVTDSTASWTTNQWAGARVVVGEVWGNIVSNTGTVLTVDRWYTPATPGGSAGTTPSSGATYVILDGNSPAWFIGLSTSTTTLASPSTNTSLPSEITTSGGGLIRKISPYAHTASADTYTLTPVYTANGSDSLPATIGSIGVFDSMVPGDTTSTMLFNTVLGTSATLSASGDTLTLTETVTGT